MIVDVLTEIEIDRPRAEVAAYAADPENATAWYENIERVEWKTAPPPGVGSRIAFVARFLGRRLAYIYEVTELIPDERLVMRTADGPFPMETTYIWSDTTSGGTMMTLRNRGRPSRFSKLAAPDDDDCNAPGKPHGPRAPQADPRVAGRLRPRFPFTMAFPTCTHQASCSASAFTMS